MRKQTKLVAALSATALLAIGASAVSFAAGWNNTTGNWQYLDNEGNPIADAWRKSGDYWFYLGSDGNMATNQAVSYNEDFYYVNQDGAMVTNQWVAFDVESDDSNADHRWMYFGADGKAYRARKDSLNNSDIKTINGKKYLFDMDGYMLFGWLGGEAQLKLNDDAWNDADTKYYYGGFDDGSAQHGWVQLTVNDNGEDTTAWFYFDNDGKVTRNAKKTINGVTYYFGKDGRMIEDWSTNKKVGSSPSAFQEAKASDSYVYVNGDGGARKNRWIWAVPTKDLDEDDYNDDNASWWWADASGKIVKNTVKKIRGKVYAFDEIGRMLSGLQIDQGANGFTSKVSGKSISSMDGTAFAAASIGDPIYFFSSDYAKDGSRKTGYQKVEFDDDTYQMYFNNNGKAGENYVSKIKKFVANGVVLAANNDDSNFAGIKVLSDAKTLDRSSGDLVTYDVSQMVGRVLVNVSGTVQMKKTNIKDSNDVYYLTDDKGVILYAGDKKLYKNNDNTPHNHLAVTVGNDKYYTE